MLKSSFMKNITFLFLLIFIQYYGFSQPSIQWQKCIGGTLEDKANSISLTVDGGYVIAGSTFSNDGDIVGNRGWEDFLVIKIDSTGSTQWVKCLGGTHFDKANSIKQTNDYGYIFAGTTRSDDG